MGKQIRKDLLSFLKPGYSPPPLSPVAVNLVELAADENCSADDLANLIETDPSLAVRLLKLANSAFFQTLYPAATLNQAVVRVGFHHLRIMALSVSLRDAFPFGKIGSLDYENFWRISIYRALIAKYLARHLQICNSEEAFVAALTMEIGLLVFLDLFIKGSAEDIELKLEPLENLLLWEKEQYGVDHRQIGEEALRYWKFPENIIACQKASNDSLSSEDCDPIVRLCQLASVLTGIVSSNSEDFEKPYKVAEKFLGLDQTVINNIIITTFEQVEDIADSLRVNLKKENDLLRIVEKANLALSHISEKISTAQQTQGPNSLPAFDSLGNIDNSIIYTLQAVVHEIRNPLTAIGGFARRLVRSAELDSAGSKYAHAILKEAERLEEFMSKLMSKTQTADE